MELYLLLGAVIILLCVIFNRISSRLGVPVLLAFIFLGMVFGSDGVAAAWESGDDEI
ncbi:MAG: hypothetical protein IJE70_03825 [Oscillospiraceae bacterium]|nr:hypothetical protein [Oscillospiraceae bacterium]